MAPNKNLSEDYRRYPLRSQMPMVVFPGRSPPASGRGPLPFHTMTPTAVRRTTSAAHLPPQLIRILLTKGGVEPISGPGYPCGVCGFGAGTNSLKCSGCHFWFHSRCSLLPRRRHTPGKTPGFYLAAATLTRTRKPPPLPTTPPSSTISLPSLTTSVKCHHCNKTIARIKPSGT